MGTLRLLPLLASLQILLPLGSPTDLPPPPNITVTPQKLEYLIGDTVSLRCTAPRSGQKVQGFQFSGTGGWAADVRTAGRTYVYRFNVTGPKDGGSHACTYVVTDRFRRPLRSRESEAVTLTVKDRPPRPTLTSSAGVAVAGQALVFLCAAPGGGGERRFRFYKDGAEVTSEDPGVTLEDPGVTSEDPGMTLEDPGVTLEDHGVTSEDHGVTPEDPEATLEDRRVTLEDPGVTSEDPEATLEDRRVTLKDPGMTLEDPRVTLGDPGVTLEDHGVTPEGPRARLRVATSGQNRTGNFTCGYEEETAGRWIPSYPSQAVEVLVKEPAPAPRLAVDPPTGVVSVGDPLQLTCEASRGDFKLRFRFYRNGGELPPGRGRGATGVASRLLFAQSPKNFSGKFSCGVEEEVGGTWVPSPRSRAVDVAVKDLPSQPALLLDPSSGQVIDGDPLLLTCVAAGPAARRKFAFYRDGAEQFSETGTKDRAAFNIPAAQVATGRFTCRYEEMVNDRWIPSPFSQAKAVSRQARSQLIPLVAGCVGGAAALLLGLLLAVCVCRRRRGSVHWKGLHNKDDPSTYPMAKVVDSSDT